MTTIAIAGNPNCGKSALFNALTGIRQTTGNWPGVTVERKQGQFRLRPTGEPATLIDLPGIYTLDALSLDERVTRDYLLSGEAEAVINVVDAANLERNLYLTVQLLEMGVPMVLALNMMDVARKRGQIIDVDALSEALGCPVVPVVAVRGEGLDDLKQALSEVIEGRREGGYRLGTDEIIEEAIADLGGLIPGERVAHNRHWMALKLLEGDLSICPGEPPAELLERLRYWRHHIEQISGESADVFIADVRYSHAHAIAARVVRQRGKLRKHLSDRIDRWVLHRWLGVPLFLFVMYLMFLFTINFGGAFIDFFDGAAAALFVDGFGAWLDSMGAPGWLRLLLADGIGGGVQVVATFIPIITCLYLFLSFLEDSGYMARAAFVMDRFMRGIGLPGKAFVPMIVGFGCNVPAVMATRTLENERERKLTILMNPFMSCGARLPVYVLFAAAFFPSNGQNLVFLLYLVGISMAVLTGLVMKHSLLSGQSSGFLMELPTYHLPTLKGIALRTWDRVKLFVRDAGKVIIVMVVVLNVLNSIGSDGSIGNEDSEHSILSVAGKTLTPLFEPMGIQPDNWPATVGIFTGVLAKEVVVGTLDALYSRMAEAARETEATRFDLGQALADAARTIPDNLSALGNQLLDPLGLSSADVSDSAAVAGELAVDSLVFGEMIRLFDGQAGAFAYLLFVLLYFPCVATMAAISREAGLAWAVFTAFWTTSMAYVTATAFYQLARFSEHPFTSTLTLLLVGAYLLALLLGLRWYAGQRQGLRERLA